MFLKDYGHGPRLQFFPPFPKKHVSLHEVMTAGRCDPKNAQHYVLGIPLLFGD
jgi:hypothetical protein